MCHLVAVTLLAGRAPLAQVPAELDGMITVVPDARADAPAATVAPPPERAESPAPRSVVRRLGRASKRPIRPTLPVSGPPAPRPARQTPAAPAPRPLAQTSVGVVPEARAVPAPARVDAAVARGLRVYDTFPRMPEILRKAPHAEAIEAEICVSEQGTVRDVRLRGGSPVLEKALRAAILSWRYRPHVVDGAPTPFCHMLRLAYRAG